MQGDWITLALFLFFFVILPILQGIGQRRKAGQQEEAPPEAEWDEVPDDRAAGRRRIEPEEWDTEWEDWDRPARQEQPAAGERSAWEDLGLDDLFREPAPAAPPRPAPRPEPRAQPEPAPRPMPAPEPARDPVREVREVWVQPSAPRPERPAPALVEAVSLEPLRVDYDAERAKYRARYPSTPQHPGLARGGRSQWLPDLRDRRELRRAIITAEVLGKPRALREHEQL